MCTRLSQPAQKALSYRKSPEPTLGGIEGLRRPRGMPSEDLGFLRLSWDVLHGWVPLLI